MEEAMLPSIKDMYNCTRENHDYNAVRCYQGEKKNLATNSKPTKKDHYLDWATRLNCSPGPASTSLTTQTPLTVSWLGPERILYNAREPRRRPTSMI